MSRRIEIEITSQRSESEWTWRAAGAKQPKGVLDAAVLYEGAKVGDVTKADAEFEIDGITILAVMPPKGKRAEKPVERIEIKGSNKEFKPVTSQLAEKSERRGRSGPRRGERGERGDRPEGARGDRRPRTGGERTGGGARTGSDRPRRERPERPARPQAPQYKKLVAKDDNRKAVLAEVPAEQRPIAEQVLRGGIPAVRQAIESENTKAKAEGRPEINGPALIAIAEELLPRLKTAEWMDRAQAAKAQAAEISVRDLRTVVSGADAVARTDEARLLASELRTILDERTAQERSRWIKDIETALEENRVVRALRLSARPPDPQVKFPAELNERLKTAAETSMAADTPAERWLMLIDAVAASPVRRSVTPSGWPEEPGDELVGAAKAAAGRIPALAKLLGVTMPPPPPVRKPPAPPAKPAPSAEASQPAAEASPAETADAPAEAPAEPAGE